jgi:hypothetical protein
MNSGIRATIAFSDPGDCPIAAASRVTGDVIEQVSTSVGTTEHPSVSEFLVKASDLDDIDAEPTFSYGAATVFRTRHEGDPTCPCELLGQHGCPVHRHVAADGKLKLVFHVSDRRSSRTSASRTPRSTSSACFSRRSKGPLTSACSSTAAD